MAKKPTKKRTAAKKAAAGFAHASTDVSTDKKKAEPKRRGPTKPFLPGNKMGELRKSNGSAKRYAVRDPVLKSAQQIGKDASPDLMKVIVKKAKTGDIEYMKVWAKCIMPKPSRSSAILNFEAATDAAGIADNMALVVTAAGRGEPSTEAAAALATVIKVQLDTLQVVDFEKRLADLEQQVTP